MFNRKLLFFLILIGATFAATQTLNKKVGEKFDISLKSNPSTGYRWQYVPEENVENPVVELVENHFISSIKPNQRGPRYVGSGGTQKFTFKTLRAGSQDLKFVHVRPWEHTNPVPEVYHVVVA